MAKTKNYNIVNERQLPILPTQTSTQALTISASLEFVIHILDPLSTQWSPFFSARVWRANASDPEATSDRQKLPSYTNSSTCIISRNQYQLAYLGLGKLWEIFVLLCLGRVLAEDGVDERVVYVDHNRNRRVDFGELLNGNYGRGERRLCSTMICTGFDTHELIEKGFIRLELSIMGKGMTGAHPLLEKGLDNSGIHGLCLIHFPDFGCNDIFREPFHLKEQGGPFSRLHASGCVRARRT